MAIGDTYLVTANNTVECVTKQVQKKYTEISYQLEDLEDDEEGEAESEELKKNNEASVGSTEVVVQGRTGTSVIKS